MRLKIVKFGESAEGIRISGTPSNASRNTFGLHSLVVTWKSCGPPMESTRITGCIFA